MPSGNSPCSFKGGKGTRIEWRHSSILAINSHRRSDGSVLAAEPGEHLLADVRVERVELIGQFASDGFGGAEKFIELALNHGSKGTCFSMRRAGCLLNL